jgi:hypothetical protein
MSSTTFGDEPKIFIILKIITWHIANWYQYSKCATIEIERYRQRNDEPTKFTLL